MYRRHRLGTTLLLLAVTATVVGCAQQQDPVDRVEAYALPKSMFAGEWYYNKTVIDTPSSQSIAFIGQTSWGSQFRIRWDVQENYLYARTAYELIAGAKNTSSDTGEYKGTIVGAWKISSHFDVKQGYNPSTGEKTNVLTENSQDCVWYNCKYVRVDWSKNHATDVNFLHWGFSGSIKKEALPFYVQDPSDRAYKPIFDNEAGYIDVTTALAVKPQSIYFHWWNIDIPLCYLRDNASCQTEIVKVRHSFMRKAPNRDYEPRLHRGEKDEWFGYFVTERFNYHVVEGLTYKTKKHYMNRHNIWEKSHDSAQTCTKDADCKTAGSRCDTEIAFHKFDVAKDSDHDGLPDDFENDTEGLDASNGDSDGDGLVDSKDDADADGVRNLETFYAWDAKNMEYWCTVPLNKRVPKPIVYFTTGDFPKSMRCDEHVNQVTKDFVDEPCKPWKWSADRKTRLDKWSALHYASVNYNDNWWKVYLRGAYGWSEADLQKWLSSNDSGKFSGAQRQQLDQFGDKDNGYYSFAICPNNPIEETDAWPCRFPRHSFAQAKELMGRGLKFNHQSYELAKSRLDAGRPVDNTQPYVRVGDMRYSYVHWVKEYSPTGPLGYGPNTSDVRTGEIISGYANIYTATDFVATRIDDLIGVLNGETPAEDYINGVSIRAWIAKVNAEATATQASAGHTTTGFHNRSFSPQDVTAMYKSMNQPWMKKIAKRGSPQDFAQMQDASGNQLNSLQLKTKLMESLDASGLFNKTKNKMDLSILKGSSLERRLIDEEVLMAAGYRPDKVQTISEEVLNNTSIARGGLFGKVEAREEFRDAMRRQGVDFADDFLQAADEGLSGLSSRLKTLDPKVRWATIRNILTRPLVVHEMGHSLGLMHNFGGSEDVVNYHKEYWKLRTNDGKETAACTGTVTPGDNKLCPFYLKPMNDYQLGRDQKNVSQNLMGMTEYAYSSVMDYDRYSTMMGLGLGRYDTASFVYGYTDKVEVYKNTGSVPLSPDNIFDQWHEGQGTVLLFGNNAPKSFHYTKWYTMMGDKLTNESNRELVDYREMKKVRDGSGKSQGWFHVKGNTKKVRVPYIYCTHGRTNISGRCMTWDWGADFYERMKMHVDNWDMWYVLNSFPRGRVGWSKGGYINSRYGRFYKRLKNFNNTYALYQTLFNQWYPNAAVSKFFSDPVDGWGDYTVAMHDGFNTLMQTLAMPDVKSFTDKAKQNDGQEVYNEAVFGSMFETNVTNARYFSTSYYNTDFEQPNCGQYWYECLHHFGFYMDKVMAMFALSDARTYFVGQDTSADRRLYRINFFDNFSTQIISFFSAMLAEQHASNSPWFNPDLPYEGKSCSTAKDCGGTQFQPTCFKYPGDSSGACKFKFPPTIKGANNSVWVNGIARRDYATPALDVPAPAKGGPIEASTRFTLQLYGAVMGMFLFQQNYDNAYAERGRMWKKGKDTTWVIKPTAEILGVTEYISPYTGVTYSGIKFKDGKGIAQSVIAHANALKARTKYCSAVATDPDACVAGANQSGAEFELKIYADLLDVIVQVTTMYDERL